jgi:hypothetical protein
MDRRVRLAAERGRRVDCADLAHRHPDVGPAALDRPCGTSGERRDRGFIDRGGGGIELQWAFMWLLWCRSQQRRMVPNVQAGQMGRLAHNLTSFPSLALSRSGSEGVSHPRLAIAIGRTPSVCCLAAHGERNWRGCKGLYTGATARARDMGEFEYVRSNPVRCRLVMIKRTAKGRKCKTVFGKDSRSRHSKKQRAGQNEPWLLATSPSLSMLSAKAIVALYSGRMQIEETFRDIKNPQWGMGLSTSQTRPPKRLAALLLIAALLSFALWLIGLAVRESGYCIQYGSRKKSASTLSILSLARQWLFENNPQALLQRQLDKALVELTSMVVTYEI